MKTLKIFMISILLPSCVTYEKQYVCNKKPLFTLNKLIAQCIEKTGKIDHCYSMSLKANCSPKDYFIRYSLQAGKSKPISCEKAQTWEEKHICNK